jgi:integrase
MEVVVMTTNATAGVYRRCGCIDQTGRRRGLRCSRRADPDHGSWYFAVQVTECGRRVRVRRGGYATAYAARTARDAVFATQDACHGWTVAGWLRHWLSTLPGQVRPSTLVGYRRHVHQYLIPHLGGYRLAELTVAQVEQMFAHITADRHVGGSRVTAATAQRIKATLRRALNVAVRDQLLLVNPARLVVLPRPVRHRPQPWTPARVAAWRHDGWHPVVAVWDVHQLATFLAVVCTDGLFALWWLAALRGLRRGEICALRWVDLDLCGGTLTVHQQMCQIDGRVHIGPVKTPAGERAVALDAATVAVLREHQRRQYALVKGAGRRWRPDDYVFTLADGRPVRPDWLSHRFHHLVTTSGLPPIRFHDLRHGAATLALAAHVDMKVVQDMLGHASLAFTADTYAAVLPEVAHAAAAATAGRLLGELTSHPRRRPPVGRVA